MRTQQSQSVDLELKPEEWVDQFGDAMFAYAYSRLRDQADAEEAVQETFLAAVRKREQFRGESHLGGWLHGILKRKVVDQLRARNRRQRLMKDTHDPAAADSLSWLQSIPAIDTEDQVSLTELWHIVLQCLTTLPPDQADAFTLTVMDQVDAPEACRILNVSEASFRVRLHRARVRLARCVTRKWETDN